MRRITGFLLIIIGLLSCAAPRYREVEYGIASWYGAEFHGRRTASGEIYNMYDMTAAHNTLPLGSRVMVTNLENGRSVEVTINDRGPFVPGRIIDLSYAAARALGMDKKGLAMVKIEPLDLPKGKEGIRYYTIQVGAFVKKENAKRLKEELEDKYKDVYISEFNLDDEVFYRVRIGRYDSMDRAYKMAERLSEDGYTVLIMSNP